MNSGETISWQQFGEVFVQQVFTPRRVGPQVHRGLPPQTWLKMPAPGGEALVVVDMLAPEVTQVREGMLRIDLHMRMRIDADVLGFLQADATIDAVVTLFLAVEFRWPLTVFLNARTVTRDDVAIDTEAASIVYKAAEAFGQLPDIRVELAKAIDAEIVKGIAGRTIDVLALVNESNPERTAEELGLQTNKTDVSPAVPAGTAPGDGWPQVSPAEVVAAVASAREKAPAGLLGGPTVETAQPIVNGARLGGDLAENATSYYVMPMKEGQEIAFTIYSRVLGGGAAAVLTGSLAAVDEYGGIFDSTAWSTTVTGDAFERQTWTFTAPNDGEFRFRVHVGRLTGDAMRFMLLVKA